MKEFLALFLIILLLSAAVINVGMIKRLCDDIENMVENASLCTAEGNRECAYEYAEKAVDFWNKNSRYTKIVLQHEEIDTVADSLYSVWKSVISQNTQEVEAAAQNAIYHLKNIYEAERISLGSIF